MSRTSRTVIDPDDLRFMVEQGTPCRDLATRVGCHPESLARLARQHHIPLPDGWKAVLTEERCRRKRQSRRRLRIGLPHIPRGQGVKRPDDCCPYCPTTRAAQPAEQLLWAMNGGPHCGRRECYRQHERWRYAQRRQQAGKVSA